MPCSRGGFHSLTFMVFRRVRRYANFARGAYRAFKAVRGLYRRYRSRTTGLKSRRFMARRAVTSRKVGAMLNRMFRAGIL